MATIIDFPANAASRRSRPGPSQETMGTIVILPVVRIEREVVPACAALGLGILPWSPLGRGVLTGKYRHGRPADSRAASPHFELFVARYLDPRETAGIDIHERDLHRGEPTQQARDAAADHPGADNGDPIAE